MNSPTHDSPSLGPPISAARPAHHSWPMLEPVRLPIPADCNGRIGAGILRPLRLPHEIEPLVTLLRAVYTDASAWRRQRLDDELDLLARLRFASRLARWMPRTLPLPRGWAWEDGPGRLAGVVLIRPLRPGGTVQLIDHLAVRPSAQQQGIGRRLLTAALSDLRRQGTLVATLEVEPDNAVARRLYAEAGFRVVDEALDLLHPATGRPARDSRAAWSAEFTVRAYRRTDFAPLQRLINLTIPWIPSATANGTVAAGGLQAARTAVIGWLVDLIRAQARRRYVVAGAAGELLAFAEMTHAGLPPAAVLGLTPPYHRLRLIGAPDLAASTATALLTVVLAAAWPRPGQPRPTLTTVSARQPTLVQALRQAGFVTQEKRHRLALDL